MCKYRFTFSFCFGLCQCFAVDAFFLQQVGEGIIHIERGREKEQELHTSGVKLMQN